MNRALSIRSNSKATSPSTHHFSLSSLRGSTQPELSKKLYKLIKTENSLINSYESASKERISIASQLSDWGEATNDSSLSEIADKVGVLLSELGEQEDLYAHNLDDSRGVLKQIRNTEKSVQPSRDKKMKLVDEIAKLRHKEPESAKLVLLEQELVRAEAENLVAEAQLSNLTRKKIKEAYETEFAATIERAEKQLILARHGRRLLSLLDDTPIVPGNTRPEFEHGEQARQILNDAEDDLRDWQLDLQEYDLGSEGGNRSVGLIEGGGEGRFGGGEGGRFSEKGEERNNRISSGGSGSASHMPGSYAPSVEGTSVTTGRMDSVSGSYAQSEAGTALPQQQNQGQGHLQQSQVA